MEKMVIKDYFSLAVFSGILARIQTKMGTDSDSHYILWTDITASDLQTLSEDIYMQMLNKCASSRLRFMYEHLNENATQTLNALADMIALRYGDNFMKVFKAYFETDYKPLENYAMKEKRTPNLTDTGTTQSKVTTTGSTGEYGFNSSEAIPATEAETISEADAEENIVTNTHTGTEDLERSGNIGVTTSQQMLESELNLRKYDYWKMVYDTIDSVLCRGLMR